MKSARPPPTSASTRGSSSTGTSTDVQAQIRRPGRTRDARARWKAGGRSRMNMGPASAPVTFTLDVEDYTLPGSEPRAIVSTRSILKYLGERNVRGTFFIVGDLADEIPELVVDIANGGHEVALHGHRHAPLTETDPETFRREVGEARLRLEQRAGRPV